MTEHANDHETTGPAGTPGAPDDGETLSSILDRLAAEGHEDERSQPVEVDAREEFASKQERPDEDEEATEQDAR